MELKGKRHMKKFRETGRKISSMLLILLMCIALLPVGVFAEDEIDGSSNDETAVEVQAQAQDQESEAPDAEEPAVEEDVTDVEEPEVTEPEDVQEITMESESVEVPAAAEQLKAEGDTPGDETPVVPSGFVPAGKTFELNKVKVKFKKDVVPDKTSSLKPGRVWVKGQSDRMRVNWVNPKNMDPVYGVIILRATGNSKVFEEVRRLSFRKKNEYGEIDIDPLTACTDKTAKKKNTAYTYRVVSYYIKDKYIYVSPISDWAAGQTSASKLKNVYTATINKKSASLQSNDLIALTLTVASPKTKFMPTSRRWASSNKGVATVNSKGKVRARAPGNATITGTLASGEIFKCKVTVVGAFTPGTPTLKVDYATTSKIVVVWNKTKNATSYDVYKSDDGLHWDDPVRTKKTTHGFTGLVKNHRYTFYVIARNDNKGLDESGNTKWYHAFSDNSNVINQKAVVRLRPTEVKGFPSKKTLKAGNTLSVSINVTYPESRKASLQMKDGKKWVTKKVINLPQGTGTSKVKITFPNDWWWSGKTEWRLVIPKNKTAKAYTTGSLIVTAQRLYQNPSNYVQIQNSISKHGYSYYVSPIMVNNASTKSAHIEALIKTANKYRGCRYAQGKSGAPGNGIDESGLVIQACYGAGVDLWPVSPATRPYNCIPNIMNSKLKAIKYQAAAEGSDNYPTMTRGDLVFFSDKGNKTPIHVAIYTGTGSILHADPIKGNVNITTIRKLEDKDGPYKYHVVGVRRIFN